MQEEIFTEMSVKPYLLGGKQIGCCPPTTICGIWCGIPGFPYQFGFDSSEEIHAHIQEEEWRIVHASEWHGRMTRKSPLN